MDRRRAGAARPASSEEVQCWQHAKTSLTALSTLYSSNQSADTIGRVNRLVSVWPVDETLPPRGLDEVREIHRKLVSGLGEIAKSSDEQVKAIDEAIEHLEVLIALRRAPELAAEKRTKRPRQPSPPVAPVVPVVPASAVPSRISITVPPRASVGPTNQPVPFVRDPKLRRELLSPQLPLQPGRRVAFHQPSGKPIGPGGVKPAAAAASAAMDTGENWILAVVVRSLNNDKNRYEVQDAEPQEDGQPGQCYHTTLRAIIPLPDPTAQAGSPSHVASYQEFPPASTVMALYPDTSCFYRAEVIATPRQTARMPGHPIGRHLYKLKFEDDEDQEHTVPAEVVVEWPGTN
ncbi:SGF29 C-terminal domain-containing protein [Mycena chlorophos]|uniref:SGF29 C-terminal domain-containing protein n=1 Tax=Mycena chlorophos TaxID=658473 RepID=A0A8H6VP74_MYCCL|nr:SGF29 C-terminal domain-containing protein [Mycena chlorophos]